MKVKKKIIWWDMGEGEYITPLRKHREGYYAIGIPSTIEVNRESDYIVFIRPVDRWLNVDNVIDDEEIKRINSAEDREEEMERVAMEIADSLTVYDSDVVLALWDNLKDIKDTEEWEKIVELIKSAMVKVVKRHLQQRLNNPSSH